MKTVLILWMAILLCACGNSDKNEKTDILTQNFLHDIAPFTTDSLVNVVIEIPAGTRQKWEVNKTTGQIEWEQVTSDSLRVVNYLSYPANYGFVPQTLMSKESHGDGDPVDVFVLGASIDRETITSVRIVGMINMLDDTESDAKLLAVNVNASGFDVHSYQMLMNEYPGVVDIIKLWLSHYKGTDRVKILSVNDERAAILFLKTAHMDYIDQKTK